ncbi:MAG TPA: hypothetical protein VF516_12775 [Kofleriaceae bacterium]
MLGLARFVPVKNGGDLSVLAELCQQASEPGVNFGALSRGLTKQKRRWLECVPAIAGRALRDKLALLARFGVEELGGEDGIVQRTDECLERAFGVAMPGLRDSIAEWIQGVSGATDVTVSLIESVVVEPYLAERPGLITRARHRSARQRYLDAVIRSARRVRPLHAVSHQLFTHTPDLTLASVYVKPPAFTGSYDEPLFEGIPLDRVVSLPRAWQSSVIWEPARRSRSCGFRNLHARISGTRTPGGEQALDEGWPDWRDPRFQQEPLPHPSVVPDVPPPPSHRVRVRIAKLLALVLPKLTDDDLRMFTPRSQYVRDHILVDALEEDPTVAERLELRHVPLGLLALKGYCVWAQLATFCSVVKWRRERLELDIGLLAAGCVPRRSDRHVPAEAEQR